MEPIPTVTVFGIEIMRGGLIFILVLAGVWLLSLTLYLLTYRRRHKPFTAPVKAEVRYLNQHRGALPYSDDRKRHLISAAIYQYSYDGQNYIGAASPAPLGLRARKVGDRMTVYVNPDDPTQFIDRKQELFLMLPGIAATFIPLVLAYFVFRLSV